MVNRPRVPAEPRRSSRRASIKLARHFGVLIAVFAIAIVGLGFAFLLRRALQASQAMSCANNVTQIALAIESYHATYGHLPRAALLDDEGTRIHSWRTAITPDLAAIDQLYRWDQPWNGPFNVRLAKGLDVHVDAPPTDESGHPMFKTVGPYDGPIDYARPFRCTQPETRSDYHANYFAIVGDRTAWPVDRPLTLDDIGDGLENTILVAESHTLRVLWSQPDDLNFDQMSFAINDPHKAGISSLHGFGPLVAFTDGAVFHLNPKTPEHVVRALLTANGGEKINRNQLLRDGWLR